MKLSIRQLINKSLNYQILNPKIQNDQSSNSIGEKRMNHSILFVDDDETILAKLKVQLKDEPFKAFFCSDSKDALNLLKINPVSVIVSDLNMPGINGVEFLRQAQKISPYSVRILLSAYSDIDNILMAINDGKVDSFLKKPWDMNSFKIRLKNSCSYYEKTLRELELVEELEEKNQQLIDANQMLSHKVRMRTLELQENNRLMKMIIEGIPVNDILKETCSIIKNLLKLKKVYLMEVKSGSWFPDGNRPPNEVMHRQEIGRNIITQDYLCYQMDSKKHLFGYLYLYPVKTLSSDMKRVILDFSSLAEMVLLQQDSLEQSDLLVNNIDSILEELNAN